jgi:HD-GYP domain-containing protein (c-di-GMP phosphodiesterase class II)
LQQELRLAEVLAGLSLVTDLAMGQAPEKAIRSCLVATHLARDMDLPEPEIQDVYYHALLKHLGCTASTHEEAWLFGGDLSIRALAERSDFGNPGEAVRFMLAAGRSTGARRVRHAGRTMTAGKKADRMISSAVCEVGVRMADRLRLGPGVRTALSQVTERWDGKGGPQGLAGEDISRPARIAEVAIQAVIFHRLGGPEASVEMARKRSGGWFDPAVVEAFERLGPDLLRHLADADVWEEVLAVEPEPARRVVDSHLDEVAAAFGDAVDLKTPFTLSHSSEVAVLAEEAGRSLALDQDDLTGLRRAALLHDLGRAGVSNDVWEKPKPLTHAEWEQVRLHAYHTERILARSSALRPLARIAGMHHERQDGSGYHHGASGSEIPASARLLAAADAYQAMTQDRPHRPALPGEQAAEALLEAVRGGRFDMECARAVLEAAGQRPKRARAGWPAGLTDREVEVLRLLTRGMTNREVAERLFISPRTAEHHVQHIYAKIGASTRAAAAMFAMELGLLRD